MELAASSLMPNATSAANTESSHIFDLWLSQWRLAILDSNSAQPILSAVLNSMLARSGEDAFWECLQEFFEMPDHESSGSSVQDPKASMDLSSAKKPDLRHHLVERATLLPPRQVKRLLEHLGSAYSLNGEDAAFWHIVEKALNHPEMQHPEHTPHRTI